MEQLPPKAREQIAQKMLRENKGQIGSGAPGLPRPTGEPETKSKYGNKKAFRTLANGKAFKFDSQKEARRFDELMVLLQAGQIKDLKLQPEFTLREAYTDPEGWHIRPLKYRADFGYMERVYCCPIGEPTKRENWEFQGGEWWRPVVEDVKSCATKTRVYEMKKQMMLDRFQIRIREV